MNKPFGKDIARFFILIAVQVLILDHVNFYGYANPALYLYFILLLPFEVPGWLLLTSAFLMGFGIDSFSNSVGLHSATAVFVAFLRPRAVRIARAPAE